MNAARGGRNRGDNGHEDALKNKRLAYIRDEYEHNKMTPQQRQEGLKKTGQKLIDGMRSRGISEAVIAQYEDDIRYADSMLIGMPEEDPRDKIVSGTFGYEGVQVTISSEGSRHWRSATVHDCGSRVYLPGDNEFGRFDDTGYETDEDFPDAVHTTAIVSGRRERPWAYDGRFEELLIVPKEVLQGVKNEAPPGRFFSGKSLTNSHQRPKWSPAPDGKTWLQHPFLKKPNGMYVSDEQAFYMNKIIQCPGMKREIMEKAWKERETLAYWCPVLKRFLSEGERLRQEHWFHNGDGSAQQRYFYNQIEMLDLHGGLKNLPVSIDEEDDEVCFVGVMDYEEVVAKRRENAEAKGEIVEIDQDSKMPAKRQRTT